jgi:energy-coupling factor transporter ATP-binding protein EcfA2
MPTKKPAPDLIPKRGERAFVTGQTGSGKSAFVAQFLLPRIDMSPIIIYDTKDEPKFDALKPARVVATQEQLDDAYRDQEIDYIIVRPPISVTSDPDALDDMLYHHYEYYPDSVCYIDELYQFVRNFRAGRGLQGLLTRGRSRGITTIMASQRPAFIPMFALTESQKFYIFFLAHEDDRKRIAKVIRGFGELPDPVVHGFYFYELGPGNQITKYGPIKLDKALDVGYTDITVSPEAGPGSSPELPKNSGKVWI